MMVSAILSRKIYLKLFFSGLRIKETCTISWYIIQVSSAVGMYTQLWDVEDELKDHRIQLFPPPDSGKSDHGDWNHHTYPNEHIP